MTDEEKDLQEAYRASQFHIPQNAATTTEVKNPTFVRSPSPPPQTIPTRSVSYSGPPGSMAPSLSIYDPTPGGPPSGAMEPHRSMSPSPGHAPRGLSGTVSAGSSL